MASAQKPLNRDSTVDRKVEPLAITYRNVRELIPDPQNPRVHSKKQIQQIATSIQTFGFNTPILLDRKLQIVAGHGRVEAAKTLGISRVPTIHLDHLSKVQLRAFMIADNRLSEPRCPRRRSGRPCSP
jgi:ParB-like chromosome segregation protein Spo0J